MQAHELLVGHMRLHNSRGLVGWTWCVKKISLQVWCLAYFQTLWAQNSKGTGCILVPTQTPKR